jgi:putative sterol carrier protein
MSIHSLPQKLPYVFNASRAGNLSCTIQFNVSRPFFLAIKDGACSMTEGTASAPDLSLAMNDDLLEPLLSGKVSGMAALMQRKLRFKGDLGLAQKISNLFDLGALDHAE